jgi:Beta-ketoacyl synthase, N-terminal domain
MTANINHEAELRHWLVSLNDLRAVGGRFPGKICGPQAFWQFLCEGSCAIGEIPPGRRQPFEYCSPGVAPALARISRGARS